MKRQGAHWKNILQNIYLIKDLHPEYAKNSQNSTMRKSNNFLNRQNIGTDISPKRICRYQISTCYVASVVSDSVWPHRQQPTRLPRPWDSPGKNTGVGCHFLLQCMKVKSESEVAQSCPTLSDPMDSSLPGSSAHGIFQARVLEWGAIAFSEY